MNRNIYFFLLISILTGLIVFGGGATAARPDDVEEDGDYEVWVIDQSNTKDEDGNGTLDSGGTLYIYQGDDLTGDDAALAAPTAIDPAGRRATYVWPKRALRLCGLTCSSLTGGVVMPWLRLSPPGTCFSWIRRRGHHFNVSMSECKLMLPFLRTIRRSSWWQIRTAGSCSASIQTTRLTPSRWTTPPHWI